MASLKQKPLSKNWLKEAAEEFYRTHTLCGERWYVAEYHPPYDDGYGYDIGEYTRVCSDYFDTKEGAVDFIARHDPHPGTTFKLGHQKQYSYTAYMWV